MRLSVTKHKGVLKMNREQWEEHFVKQQESSLNIRQYCVANNLKYKNFTGAQHRYKTASVESSFISVVTASSHNVSQSSIKIQISLGQTNASIENCTPQWFAQFLKEVI